MTVAASPLIEPAEAALMLRRELEVLGELAELGLRMARTIVAQATGEATAEPPIQGDLPLAFSRVSRAVRMAVLLQSKLIQGPRDEGRKGRRGEDEDEEISTDWRVEWVTVDADGNEIPRKAEERDEPSTERREGEACERLERDDIYAAVMGRPKEEVIERIREDLGGEPCAGQRFGQHANARSLLRAGVADPGEKPGEERVVEGAGQAHYATPSPVSDSS